jgi:hypothetical protein
MNLRIALLNHRENSKRIRGSRCCGNSAGPGGSGSSNNGLTVRYQAGEIAASDFAAAVRRRVAPLLLLLLWGGMLYGQCDLTLARLKYDGGGDWYNGPSSLPNLISEVRARTALPLCDTAAVVEVMDDRLFNYPFLYMTGHGNVHFTNAERLRLRAFLIGGGFLFANDDYGMDTSFRREMKALFPENPLVEVPAVHPVYSSVVRLPGMPKVHVHDGLPAQGLGIFWEGRLVVFYAFSADIGDGMENAEVYHDRDELRRAALDMGVNIVAWFFSPKEITRPSGGRPLQ